ncbi:ABC transporter permease [Xanthomonas sp. CFBP 8703]|uniref:ABC transporter permease n=1 Tax=Xanthomonas bonasiae TaxID=2810351 RepID=A0ABS3B8I6_9XANT|nr:ABC transporter permease [Xanthomonas bonasiae]MBN6104930.1 ABC transporter permease [Xanthomonas bonasiae]
MKNLLVNLALVLLSAAAIATLMVLPMIAVLAAVIALALWMGLTSSGRRAGSVTLISLSTLRGRLGSSSVIVVGMAGVVGVLIALLAMGEGFRATLQGSGRDDTAIVTRSGAVAESSSALVRSDIDVISQAPGVERGEGGDALMSAELVVPVNVSARSGGESSNIALRGVDPFAWTLRPTLKIVEGRAFKPGLHELVVGRSARVRFAGLNPGDDVKLGTEVWRVVGVFESGQAYDSELWGDRQSVAATYRRGSSVSSVQLKLAGSNGLRQLQAALQSDPRITVEAVTTREFFARQSKSLFELTKIVGLAVGIIMGIGALFGALNCMFAAVGNRAREIATLRALGFQGVPVVISVMLEAMLLALVGGVLGAVLVWLIFNGHTVSTLNGFNQFAFQFKVSPELVLSGLKWALAIGFIGGLFPAVHAANMQLAEALRES